LNVPQFAASSLFNVPIASTYKKVMRTYPSFLIVSAIDATLTGCKSNPPAPVNPPTPMVTPTETAPAPTADKSAAAGATAVAPTPGASPEVIAPASNPPGLTSLVPTKPAVMSLKFNSTSIDAIQAGTKTSTTRKGVRLFPGNKVTALDASDADRTLNLDIVSAIPKKLSDLTEADAKSDGSDSLDAFKTTMTKNYPGITSDDMVTVITFKLAK
jgi:uncharacterized protein YqfB (UPF0267 family)